MGYNRWKCTKYETCAMCAGFIFCKFFAMVRVSNYAVTSTVQDRHSPMFCSIMHRYMYATYIVLHQSLSKRLGQAVTINIFRKRNYFFKNRINLYFHNKYVQYG